jgi:CDP-diacylglycerol--glycerol-3-phosphate 3-phosphatidyltransferase
MDGSDKSRWIAIGLMVAAGVTDFLDGHIARRLSQVTDVGKILDPLADKVCVGGIAVVLLVQGNLALWYVILVLARDLIIFLGGCYIAASKRTVPQSNQIGKITVASIGAAILFSAMNLKDLTILRNLFLWISVVLIFGSLLSYGNRFIVVARKDFTNF